MRLMIAASVAVQACLCLGATPAEPFEFGKERDWEFLNQARFRGSLAKIEGGKVFIRMSDGVTREFWPGEADGVAGSFLQRAMCKLPASPARPEFTPGTDPLIDLSAAELPAGPLARWKNTGRLGGNFTVMNQPPDVVQLQGRKAVMFAHSPWLLPLEFQTLVSDFYMPEQAISGNSLTVVAWLYNTGGVVDRETFLCWGEKDCGELDTPDFSYGCYEFLQWYNEKMTVSPERFPKLNQWHQLAFVVRPAQNEKNRSEVTLYVDGQTATGKVFRKPADKLLRNNLVFLGCAWEAWWGHAWATRPARPYTGAMAGLRVYDRPLTQEELRRLGGFDAPKIVCQPWPATTGAGNPQPAAGSDEVSPGLERLAWKPNPDATAQTLYFGSDRDAVAKGSAASIKLKPYVEEVFLPIDLKLPHLECGKTFYWRVEQVVDPKQPALAGEIWSFRTSRFDLEFDGPVSEAFPGEVAQDGFYSRYMDAGDYPIISPPGNHDIHMRAARHALQKLLTKRPDLVTALQASNAACHLASREHPGWGWSHFTCSCYGSGEAILREGAIMMHEMGHQFQMQGAEAMEVDFRHRLGEVFNAARHERLWMGDYGGSNMWENVAVCASWWINDMAQDEGDLRPREILRRNDPRVYHLLNAYWPGDLMIDLRPACRLRTDADGGVLEWGNSGGIEYFKPNAGWRYYQRSSGSFLPVTGKPALVTVGAMPAVAFNGDTALAWNQITWDSLDTNRAWSVDAWVFPDSNTAAQQALLEWSTSSSPGAKLLCGPGEQAYQVPGGLTGKWTARLAPGKWHHLAWVYTGGGVDDGPGELQLYMDGKPAGGQKMKLALPVGARVAIGQGFSGALGHLRIYNYDLRPLQIQTTWNRESPAFCPPSSATAGRLLVNMDARRLTFPEDTETCPFYPASLNKPWLRSWANLGTLGGKIHNDAGDSSSQPVLGPSHGTLAVNFDGKSRMIGSFIAPPPIEGSVEMWVCALPGQSNVVILQWGPWSIPASIVRGGAWQHVVAIFRKGAVSIFVDGIPASVPAISGGNACVATTPLNRLIVGGGWDGKTFCGGFRGSIAQLRVHDKPLTPEQVTTSSRNAPQQLSASQPASSGGELVMDLDASALPSGPVKEWAAKGSAGCVFQPVSERPLWRPVVLSVDGRRGLDFSGRKSLVSTAIVPESLLGGGSFTVSLWAYCRNTGGLEREQTMLSWGRRPRDHVEFCWGSDIKKGAFIGGVKTEFGYKGPEIQTDRFRYNAPLLNNWHHFAFTFNPSSRLLRIYVDGRLNREEGLTLNIPSADAICLGGVRTGRLADAPFSGLLGEVALADSILPDADIARLAKGDAASSLSAKWLVRLDPNLPDGPLSAWKNYGSLGGEFVPEAQAIKPPQAEHIAGRAGVTFDGLSMLQSSVNTPAALTGDHPFTVEMWVLGAKFPEAQTVLALAPSVAMKSYPNDVNTCAANFNFGSGKEMDRSLRPGVFSSGQSSRNVGWTAAAPVPSQWQHVACVYEGGYRGTFTVYLNGRKVNQRGFFTLDTIGGYPVYLGGAWNTSRGAMNLFIGSISRLRVYNFARSEQEIRIAAGEK